MEAKNEQKNNEIRRIVNDSSFASDYLNQNILAALANDYQGSGQFTKSITSYERVSELLTNLGHDQTRTGAEVLHGGGQALLNAGRAYEAEAVLRRALDVNRTAQSEKVDDPRLPNSYAEALRQLEHLEEAAGYAERGYAKCRILAP